MGTRVRQTSIVDAARFRRALGRHAAGVVVVTGPGPVGLTATSLTSVSLDPPLVSFCVSRGSTTWPDLRQANPDQANPDRTDDPVRADVNRTDPGRADVDRTDPGRAEGADFERAE